MSAMTMQELLAAGYRIVDGVAVRDVDVVTPSEAKAESDWREVQRQCHRVFADAGCTVYWLSQARRTGQTPGLPDLLVFGSPGHAWHAAWETKSGRGKASDAQRKFALHCERTGFAHGTGGVRAAREFLKAMNEKHQSTACGKCGQIQSAANLFCEMCGTVFVTASTSIGGGC